MILWRRWQQENALKHGAERWGINLIPEGGARGGEVIATGTPEQVADIDASHTGRTLRELLRSRRPKRAAS